VTDLLLYSFDTSAVINGRRDLLPPEVFPSVWSKVEGLIASGAVHAVDEVRAELGKRDDSAKDWANAQTDLFVPLEADIQVATAEILRDHQKLMGTGKGRNGADPFVIGLAKARSGIVVTEESATNNLSKPKIPDVCQAVGVRCVTLVGFIRDQGWTF
jgi:hypothetical protein